MAKIFDTMIMGLERKKTELDLPFLQSQKEENEKRLAELFGSSEGDEKSVVSKFNEAKQCYDKINEINYKIQYFSEIYEEEIIKIDDKIDFYKRGKEKVNNIPLYRNTEEGIAEILGDDPVYQYAKETCKENLIKKLEERSLTPNEYLVHIENMYREILKEYKKSKEKGKEKNKHRAPRKIEILLPEGMTEQIFEELKYNKHIKAQDIERFLKNELKKNAGEIMISHIKNKFKDNYDQVYEYIRKLITNYSGFQIIENIENNTPPAQTKTKRDKLISSISSEESEEYKNERLKIGGLLIKLNTIGEIEDLKIRISKYLDLFEELNQDFEDRKYFEPKLYEIITKYTHIEIEKEIIKTLNLLIQGKPCVERTGLYKYNVYKFNRASWRMLAYPNGEIFTICPHEEYEKIINTQPPVDKIE